MAAPKTRNNVEREARLARIEQMRLRGRRDWEIAQELGISTRQVYYDLKVIEERWKASSLADLDAYKKAELAEIDELMRTYWTAWEESKREKQTTSTEQSDGGKEGSRKKAAIKREQKEGNPAFLTGIQWCVEQRCKIRGIYAPVKYRDVTELTDEELLRIAAGSPDHSPTGGTGDSQA